MTVGDKVSDFLSYWCRCKCPYRDVEIFNDEPVTVDIDDYDIDCVCPKCGEEFRETVDGNDMNYELDSYNFQTNIANVVKLKNLLKN